MATKQEKLQNLINNTQEKLVNLQERQKDLASKIQDAQRIVSEAEMSIVLLNKVEEITDPTADIDDIILDDKLKTLINFEGKFEGFIKQHLFQIKAQAARHAVDAYKKEEALKLKTQAKDEIVAILKEKGLSTDEIEAITFDS